MPDETGGPLAVALRLLRADAPAQIIGAPEVWPRWSVLLPHVLAATRYPGSAGEPPGPDVMGDVSWLLDRAGAYLQVQARFTDARPAQERALAIAEATYGPDHPDVATDLNNLATILRDLGLPAEARPLQERALAVTEGRATTQGKNWSVRRGERCPDTGPCLWHRPGPACARG